MFITIFTAMLLIGLSLTNTSYASSEGPGISKGDRVQFSITNNQTGETKLLEPVVTKNIKLNSDNYSVEEGYKVFVPITDLNSSNVSPFTSEGKTKTSGGVTATLNVDYNLSSDGTKVRLNKVWGNWTPSSNLYVISNRNVDAHSSTYWGNKLSKTPTSNTFTYTTGWGYNTRVLGDGGPRAWSSAKIVVSGMGGITHTINVDFNFAN